MVKRLLALSFIALVTTCFCLTFAQRGQLTKAELIYYRAMVNTVKIFYLTPSQVTYGTKGAGVITGSGVIIAGGQVLTCHHIFSKFPDGEIRIVQFNENGSEERRGGQVRVIAGNEKMDLLLLDINPSFNTECIHVAYSNPPIGSETIITGHALLGLTRLRLYRYLEGPQGIMVTPIYAGDSGGGVFNTQGELIGIIHIGLMPDKQPTLYGYAIPLGMLREFLNERPRNIN